jgi:hypothetical protein
MRDSVASAETKRRVREDVRSSEKTSSEDTETNLWMEGLNTVDLILSGRRILAMTVLRIARHAGPGLTQQAFDGIARVLRFEESSHGADRMSIVLNALNFGYLSSGAMLLGRHWTIC